MKQTIKQRFLLWRYVRRIRMCLPCPGTLKKKIISEIKMNIRQYMQEHPNAAVSQIEDHFGNPKTIVASYVADMDMVELVKAVHKRNKALRSVCACACAALILCTAYFIHEINRCIKRENDYVETYIVEFSNEP